MLPAHDMQTWMEVYVFGVVFAKQKGNFIPEDRKVAGWHWELFMSICGEACELVVILSVFSSVPS